MHWLAGLGVLLAALAWGAPSTIVLAQESAAAERYIFAFQDAEVRQVVEEVLDQAGVPFAIDPGVSGRISFRIEQQLTREQLLAALEATLAVNGVVLVQGDGQVLVVPQAKARAHAGVRTGPVGGGTGYEIVAVPLSYAPPSEVAKAMEAIASAETVLYSNDKLGLLLLGGSGQQLRSAIETLKVFDQNAFQDAKLRYFELGQAQATTVAAELDRIVQGAGLVGVSIVPLRRLNGLIVFARSPETLDEIAKWVFRLDTPGRAVASTLHVYRPRYAAAESLSRTLSSVLGYSGGVAVASSATAGPTAAQTALAEAPTSTSPTLVSSAGEEGVRIGVDKDTNTLLIVAPPAEWVQIQRILSEIDRPARQVFIEASILEVTLGREFQFGVDWSVVSDELAVSAINNGIGAIVPTFPGLSVTYLKGDVEAAVRALGTKTSVEVISAPKILALDNRTARLQIGDQVPIVVQSAQSNSSSNAQLISTVEYRSTGVILTVTPRIAGEDQIVLEVGQEVSSVARTITSGIDSPTIQQRRFESSLVVQDGGVVALGGLISSNRTVSDTGIPGLKDIPALGSLFKTEGRNQGRSELVVLLSARIIRDRESVERAMIDLAADMRELRARGLIPSAE